MTEWGYTEYAPEMADRYIRIVELSPNFPSLAGTAATVMASVGLHELSIEYADQAIATEATTKPWAKAWYAKGRSLYELGRDDEAIPVLVTATEKEPDSDGATLSPTKCSPTSTETVATQRTTIFTTRSAVVR